MDNPDKLATQDTGRRQTKQLTIQINWQHWAHKIQDEDKKKNHTTIRIQTQITQVRHELQTEIVTNY